MRIFALASVVVLVLFSNLHAQALKLLPDALQSQGSVAAYANVDVYRNIGGTWFDLLQGNPDEKRFPAPEEPTDPKFFLLSSPGFTSKTISALSQAQGASYWGQARGKANLFWTDLTVANPTSLSLRFNTSADRYIDCWTTDVNYRVQCECANGTSSRIKFSINDTNAGTTNTAQCDLRLKVAVRQMTGSGLTDFEDYRVASVTNSSGEEHYLAAYQLPDGRFLYSRKIRLANGEWEVGGNHVRTVYVDNDQEIDESWITYLPMGANGDDALLDIQVSPDLQPVWNGAYKTGQRLYGEASHGYGWGLAREEELDSDCYAKCVQVTAD